MPAQQQTRCRGAPNCGCGAGGTRGDAHGAPDGAAARVSPQSDKPMKCLTCDLWKHNHFIADQTCCRPRCGVRQAALFALAEVCMAPLLALQRAYRREPGVTCLILRLAGDVVEAHVSFLQVQHTSNLGCICLYETFLKTH